MRLTQRLIISVVFLFLLFFAVFSYLNLLTIKDNAYRDFYKRADYLSSLAATVNARDVWEFNLDGLLDFSQSLVNERFVKAVIFALPQVSAGNPQIKVSGFIKEVGSFNNLAFDEAKLEKQIGSHSYFKKLPLTWNNVSIGEVYIYFTDEEIKAELQSLLVNQVMAFMVFLAVYIVFIYLLLKHLLLSPFKGLHQLATRLTLEFCQFKEKMQDTSNFDQLKLLNREELLSGSAIAPDRKDELGDFMRAFSSMIEAISVVVSELSQYSKQVSMLNEELEERISERTAELASSNEKLQTSLQSLQQTQSQMVQQEKLASIGQLAAGVAHEINNPMGYIGSNINRLQEYFVDYQKLLDEFDKVSSLMDLSESVDRVKEEIDYEFLKEDLPQLLEDCLEGSRRVQDIVQNLKDYSRIDKGVEKTHFNINDAVSSTLKLVANELKYSCEIHTDFRNEKMVFAHAGQINQVISNLLVNAGHAVKEADRKGKIDIQTYSDERFAYLQIQDNGCGISEEDRLKIFDPFFTTKPVGEGTGLGLNISYDIIVNKHQGDISCASEVGVGTSFTVKLPIETTEVKDTPEAVEC